MLQDSQWYTTYHVITQLVLISGDCLILIVIINTNKSETKNQQTNALKTVKSFTFCRTNLRYHPCAPKNLLNLRFYSKKLTRIYVYR